MQKTIKKNKEVTKIRSRKIKQGKSKTREPETKKTFNFSVGMSREIDGANIIL